MMSSPRPSPSCGSVQRRRLSTRSGFTLLEILISLAIVGILISILLPVLGHARDAGYRTVCAGNLRQVGVAFQAYLHDHNRFPKADFTPDWRYGGVEFVGQDRVATITADRPINHYVSDRLPTEAGELVGLFRCPGDRGVWRPGRPAGPGDGVIDGRTAFDAFGTSYRANGVLMDSKLAGIDEHGRALREHDVFVDRGKLLVLGDAVWAYVAMLPGGKPLDPAGLDASWHRTPRGGNMLAMDGSTRFVDFEREPSRYTIMPRP